MAGASKQTLLARLLLEIRAAEKAMAKRVDEALEVEARLIRRMDLMAEAEKNLKATMESVRRDIEAARPLLKPLPQIREAAQESLTKAMAAVEGGVEKALTRALNTARESVEAHAQSLVSDLDTAANVFGTEIAAQLQIAQNSADALAGALHRRLESASKQYAQMETAVEERLREVTAQMYKRLEEQKNNRSAPAGRTGEASDPASKSVRALASVVVFPERDLSKLDEAAQKLASHRERVNKPTLKPISSPRPLGRAPEYLRCGQRRIWRGNLVGESILELSVRAA